jgi:hypothetical protein
MLKSISSESKRSSKETLECTLIRQRTSAILIKGLNYSDRLLVNMKMLKVLLEMKVAKMRVKMMISLLLLVL